MASSISPLSYLNTSPYQSLAPTTAASAAGASSNVGATAELQAMGQQGGTHAIQAFLNNSMAATLLQPSTGINSGTPASTLVNNMLQQVLGAYQASNSETSGSTTSATG